MTGARRDQHCRCRSFLFRLVTVKSSYLQPFHQTIGTLRYSCRPAYLNSSQDRVMRFESALYLTLPDKH